MKRTSHSDPIVILAIAASLAALGCADHDGDEDEGAPTIVVGDPASPGNPTGTAPRAGAGSTGRNGTGATVSIGEVSREEYCAGNGPPTSLIVNAGRSGGRCSKSLAAEIFQYGLCSCSDAVFTGSFAIDAFDSARGPYRPGQIGASVGVNDQLISTGVLDIHGSLIVAGGGLLPITSGLYDVAGNVMTNGDLVTTGANIHFGRDLWVNGNITTVGFASVAGDVYQTPGHAPPSGMAIGGNVYRQDFSVADPCACGEGDVLDIEAIVAAGQANSHNADVGLDPRASVNVGAFAGPNIDIGVGVGVGPILNIGVGPSAIDLECGRFALESTHFVGVTVLQVHGRTALFVDGDLTITGAFGVDLGSSGELDVFVTGNLLLTGAGAIGSRARPSALRFYVGGYGDIAITGANLFAANLYAPRSNVLVTGADEIYGSFFVGSYYATGAQVMHYDRAIVRADAGGPNLCDDTPPDSCRTDRDCGNPRVCDDGYCRPLSGPD